MLSPLPEMLVEAERGGYAVVAPDFPSLLVARALIEHAEAARAPLLLSYAPVLKPSRDVADFRRFIRLVRDAATEARTTIGLHLDHASEFQDIREAVDAGFTSVMIDASREPWDVNVARTKEVVDFAHAAGVAVEAELGHVAIGERYFAQADPSDKVNVFTDPAAAAEFVRLTGVDALAVSIGTIHGAYASEPRLDFERLEALHAQVSVPLVLHGASGTGDDNLRRAVQFGIRKINVFSDLLRAVREGLVATLQDSTVGPNEMAAAQTLAAQRVLAHYLDISGSQGRAALLGLDIPRRAEQLYRSGYGCTEAVYMAFAEAEGYASDAVQLASSMGLGGLCNQGLTCGTLLGGLLVIGVREAHVNPANKIRRRRARALGVELIQWYTQRFGSGVCQQLLQLDLSDPAQARNYYPGGYFDRVCVPMLVEMCEWLVQRFAWESAQA